MRIRVNNENWRRAAVLLDDVEKFRPARDFL